MASKVDMLFRTITVDMLICRGRLNKILYTLLYATLIQLRWPSGMERLSLEL